MARQKIGRRSELALALGVLVLGVAISGAGALRLHQEIDVRAHEEFDRSVNRVLGAIELRFGRTIYGLNGAKGMYAANDQISRAQFRAYVASRDLPKEFPGVRGFGLIQWVQRADIDTMLADARADGAPGFTLRQLDDKNLGDLYVIRYIEPANRNTGAQGLDVGSEVVRRQGAEQAIASGEPTLTGNIVLVQDNKRSSGALLYVPLFRNGTAPHDAAQRRSALLGLLYAPIVLSELLDGIHDVKAERLAFSLFDTSHPNESVYDTTEGAGGNAAPATAHEPRFRAQKDLTVSGRAMTLQFRSTPEFDAEIDTYSPWFLLLGGSLVSALLSLLMWQQASGRRRAEGLAQEMTQDLDRLAQVVRHTSNAVSITDPDLRIRWINEGFTRITGYSWEQAIGRTPGELLASGKADPQVLQKLADSVRGASSCRVEILNRRQDGREYWVDTEVQPLFDAKGQLTGFMEIGSDITDRRRAQEQLQAVVRDNQALLHTIDMHAIVSVADGQGRITDVNAAFCKISGYRREALLGQDHRIINSGVHGKAFWRDMWALVTSGTPWRGEVCNRASDGRLYWVDTFITPFMDGNGRIEKYISIRMDITASKLAEQALEHERRTLANILDGTNAGTWEWNVQTGEARVNDRWARISGYEPDDLDFSRIETLQGLIHPEDKARSQAQMEQHFRGETAAYECETRLRHKYGDWVWVLGRGKLLSRDDQGQPLWVAGIHLDITIRKSAEFALRDSENLMRLVTENMGGRLAYFDAQRRLQFANQATLDFFGSTPADRGHITFDDMLGPQKMQRLEPMVREALGGKTQSYESSAQGSDGQMTYSVVHLLPDVRDGIVHGFVAMGVDVTMTKRAEAEIRRADQLMRAAIDATDAAFVLFDPDDRLVFCNDKYREYYSAVADLMQPGITFEALIRTAVQRGRQPEAIGHEEEWIAERLAAHRRGTSTINQRLSDGRSLRIVERRMPDGHTVGFRIDITELVEATDAAHAGSRAKSQFLANMSHEIRTPMNAILGLLTLLRKTRLDTRQSDYVVKTENAARALLSLLNDILDVSKVESGKLELDLQPFHMDEILRDLSVILAANVGDKPLEILFDVDPDVPRTLVGDAMRLQQILINLCGNAIKFTAQGEVALGIRVRNRSATGVQLQFEVQDSGIGIAPEHHAHIFGGFTQAEASTTRRFGGTGLGLAISSRLVDMMGGHLALESDLGKGSRFHFDLDLTVPASEATPSPSGAPSQPMLRVLVVDDHALSRTLLQRHAQGLGWQVGVATCASEALAMVSQARDAGQPWQVVLLDWQLPDADGWQVCQQIRALQGRAATTLVLTGTALAEEQLSRRNQDAQDVFDGFLVKPVTAAMLRDGVRQAMSGQMPRVMSASDEPQRSRRLVGMQLLVAEDNPTNQQVVRELLTAEGAHVEIAGDGATAVRMLKRADFSVDAVLMDVQMPVMDGFTATGVIRTELGRADLPIIAMTANAMASDRQACLAAGMNDHVGKPFDLDHLVEVLLTHVRPGRLPNMPLAAPATSEAPGLAPLVVDAAVAAGIDIDSALLRIGGRVDVYARLVRSLYADLQPAAQQLRAAAARADAKAAAMQLHALRGTVATLGAAKLAGVLADGEQRLAKAVDSTAINQALEPTMAALTAFVPGMAEFARVLANTQPVSAADPDAPSDMQVLRRQLQTLARQLRDSDMGATDTIASMRLNPGIANGERLRHLDAAVDALDFDAALDLCHALLEEVTA
jgi:two-component system, sensor histidine kinase and response regulator